MIHTNKQPDILNIKPVEEVVKEVEKVKTIEEELDLPDLDEDEHTNSMFQKETAPPVKKKKVMSEKQKAHMAKMRAARARKLAEKKEALRREKEELKLFRAEKLKKQIEQNRKVQKEPIPQPVQNIQEVPQTRTPQQQLNNQQYMKEFFSNLNMFMDSYNKINNTQQNIKQPVQVQTQKTAPPVKKTNPKPQNFSMLNPYVKYSRVRNPF
jgi:hypothetical protein